MDIFVSIIAVLIASAIVIGLEVIYFFVEMRMQIKSYNKRHKGKFDENANPFTMSKRYRDWYVENFANMKECSNRKDKI